MTNNAGKNSASAGGQHRPLFLLRTLRSQPYLYSAICKARLGYSRNIAASDEKSRYEANRNLFSMNDFETKHCQSLKQGFTVLEEFFPTQTIDSLFAKADRLFTDLQIDCEFGYSVQHKVRASLEGLSYRELEASEKVIALKDPILNVPECLRLAFHESLLRILGNFLGYIPPLYRVTIVRDFAHERPLESSNFHKDNDETDSVQLFIYLVDINDTVGSLIYIPGTSSYDVKSCRPRLSRDLGIDSNDGRLSDEEVLKHYPSSQWKDLKVKRGSVAIIHGNGIHKGPVWSKPGDPNNRARTAIKLDVHGPKRGVSREHKRNRIRKSDYEQMTDLQKLFAFELCI